MCGELRQHRYHQSLQQRPAPADPAGESPFYKYFLDFISQSDSAGEATIASRYTQWYSDVLLRRVSAGHICFSNTLRSFVSLTAEGAIPFNAEEFTDPSELRALAELLGKVLQRPPALYIS